MHTTRPMQPTQKYARLISKVHGTCGTMVQHFCVNSIALEIPDYLTKKTDIIIDFVTVILLNISYFMTRKE